MSSRVEELKKLRNILNIEIKGLDNFPKDSPSVFVANHNCLMDIFYLPVSLPFEIATLISSRLIYKRDGDRQSVVNRYLSAMPIEAHGGSKYADICLSKATDLLSNGISLGIFPEGAYIEPCNTVFRGRTGASRILFSGRRNDVPVNLVPVAIDITSEKLELNNYMPTKDNVMVSFLEPINYENEYYDYLHSGSRDEQNNLLHTVVDNSMKRIAHSLNRMYCNDYIELFPKGNIIFQDGSVIDSVNAQSEHNVRRYEEELQEYSKQLQKRLLR